MDRIRPYMDEATRALLVLALILLNLAYHPAPAVALDGVWLTETAIVYCGDGGPEDQSTHAPCHACRIGEDAVLPPPPCENVPARLEAASVIYTRIEAEPQDDLYYVGNRSRGPPLQP